MVVYSNSLDLQELSPIDDKWNYSKSAADMVSRMLLERAYQKHGERVGACADRLTFNRSTDLEGTSKLKLHSVNLCHVRICPICMVCKSRVESKRLTKAIEQIEIDEPKNNYLLLTLTIKNIAIKRLRETLKQMSLAWQRLVKLKIFKKISEGYFRSLEVTKDKNYDAHPHYHVLIAVNPSYFSHNYITQESWTNMWKASLRIDYIPIVDIRRIDDFNKQLSKHENLKRGVKEVAKYITKVKDLIGNGSSKDGDWLCVYFDQITNIKKNNVSGIFKLYMSDDEPDEQEILNSSYDDEENTKDLSKPTISFLWFRGSKKYRHCY